MLSGLLRVSVAVHDLESAVETYQGMGLRPHGTVQESPRGLGLRWIELGDGREAFVELITPTRDDSAVARFLAAKGEGVYQVRMATSSLAEAVERLEAVGAQVSQDTQAPGGQQQYAWIHPRSTHGVLIELVGPDEQYGADA